ncbi:MAG: histidine--tRNA ligase [Nitrospirales bacterium]|nr:MAG: histidine--tRNA ligase [Nitrospirales bacterium]
MKIRAIKGIKDILPEHMTKWNVVEQSAHRLARCFGFSEIRIPTFEQTQLFARSIGESTDVVEKEMYTFQDRDGTSLTLRPEGTAGVVRAYLEHNLATQFSMRKLYYIGPMFRHERPQAGRFRQFHQFGVEVFGTEDPYMDVEVISLLWQYFTDLQLPELTLYINSIGTPDDRQQYISQLQTYVKPQLQQFCENCQRRFHTNPLRILDCKVPRCNTLTEKAPTLLETLSDTSRKHFTHVQNGLKLLEIPYTIHHRLVRGLDYYSQTTFEITSSHLGAQNTIGAGGRYDGLVKNLGGPPTPAVGFAVGLERVNILVPSAVIGDTPPLVVIAGFGEKGRPKGLKLLTRLRQTGICTDADFRANSLKAHLRSADKLGALATIIIGDEEAQKEVVIIRNMQDKKQVEVPIALVPDQLKIWIHQNGNIF